MGLATSTGLPPEGEATELVRDRVRTLVEDLLEISRLDAGAEHADLGFMPLAEVVRESPARTGLEVVLTGAPVAGTDPRRLDRIITDLVVNAHRHGSPPVEVTVDGTTIVVRDHCVGFGCVGSRQREVPSARTRASRPGNLASNSARRRRLSRRGPWSACSRSPAARRTAKWWLAGRASPWHWGRRARPFT
jgi:hypothetical protein